MRGEGPGSFEFATAGRVLFGDGVVRQVPDLAASMGRHILVVTGKSQARAAPLVESLRRLGVDSTFYAVQGEPTTETIDQGLALARERGCDAVIGIGGGSVMDTAKFIAALVTNDEPWVKYMEVIGAGAPLTQPALPLMAISTTAGTGAEVTRNAVVGSTAHRVKVSIRHAYLLPRYAVLDPELTLGLPPSITAYSGLDALTQLIEVFVSKASNPMTDALCREGIVRARSLRAAWNDGADLAARGDMCLASLLSGMALANARLGAVHGLAGPLGGSFPAPHGAVCARLLPLVVAANIRALAERDPGHRSVERYDEVARLVTGRPDAIAEEGLAWIQDLCRTLAVPDLSAYGVTKDAFSDLIEKSRSSSSMKGNPVLLSDEELTGILAEAVGTTGSAANA